MLWHDKFLHSLLLARAVTLAVRSVILTLYPPERHP